ncbi:MAG: lysophospholipase [Candidatus Caenarcaniphilales bacterium]|nr:lysophospholipase [Candidatus Caenarcaniphilales bacterium]
MTKKIKKHFLLVTLLFGSMAFASSIYSQANAKKKNEIIVIGVHGLGARAAWLDPLKNELEANSIKFIAEDLPGFGLNHKETNPESPYKPGHVESYNEWLDFVSNQIQETKAENPESTLILFGHSLGGLISTNTPALNEVDALILSVPGYSSGPNFNPKFLIETAWKYAVSKKLQGKDEYIVMPVSKKIYPNPNAKDPYRTKAVTANLLFQVNELQGKTANNLKNVTAPLLMVQIAGDQLVATETQKEYFDLMPSENKDFKSYPGFDHDWLTNPGNEKIFNDIVSFINSLD